MTSSCTTKKTIRWTVWLHLYAISRSYVRCFVYPLRCIYKIIEFLHTDVLHIQHILFFIASVNFISIFLMPLLPIMGQSLFMESFYLFSLILIVFEVSSLSSADSFTEPLETVFIFMFYGPIHNCHCFFVLFTPKIDHLHAFQCRDWCLRLIESLLHPTKPFSSFLHQH